MFDSIAHLSYTVNNYAATTDRGSDAVVGLVVERAANVAAGVLPITDVSLVCYDRGRIYGAYRTPGRFEHRSGAQAHVRTLWQLCRPPDYADVVAEAPERRAYRVVKIG